MTVRPDSEATAKIIAGLTEIAGRGDLRPDQVQWLEVAVDMLRAQDELLEMAGEVVDLFERALDGSQSVSVAVAALTERGEAVAEELRRR